MQQRNRYYIGALVIFVALALLFGVVQCSVDESEVTSGATKPVASRDWSYKDWWPTTDLNTSVPPLIESPTTEAPAVETTDAPSGLSSESEPTAEPALEEDAVKTLEPSEVGGAGMGDGWEQLRQCESGGDYGSYTPPHFGAYQFLVSTWNSIASDSGRDDLVGVNPAYASPADQDAMALALFHRSGRGQWPVCGRFLA